MSAGDRLFQVWLRLTITRGAGYWWLSRCTVTPAAFYKQLFLGTPYIWWYIWHKYIMWHKKTLDSFSVTSVQKEGEPPECCQFHNHCLCPFPSKFASFHSWLWTKHLAGVVGVGGEAPECCQFHNHNHHLPSNLFFHGYESSTLLVLWGLVALAQGESADPDIRITRWKSKPEDII